MRWWRRRDGGDDGDGSDGGDAGDAGDAGEVAARAAMAAMTAKAVWQAVARAELRGEEALHSSWHSCEGKKRCGASVESGAAAAFLPSKQGVFLRELETAPVGGLQRDRTGAAA